MRMRVGLIVNPIAGMGGAVALKGTDGAIVTEAIRRGARAIAPERAVRALTVLAAERERLGLLTVSGEMGESEARRAGFLPTVVHRVAEGVTHASDTIAAAQALRAAGVDLLLFAGGDGTARDIHSVIGDSLPMLGIPSGVKMHSGVFAANPASAARLALDFLSEDGASRSTEIVDAGDSQGMLKLHGYAATPYAARLLTAAKSASRISDEAELEAACREVAALVADDSCTIIGPGTTTWRVKQLLGGGTLLGIDVYGRGMLIGRDLAALDLLPFAQGGEARIVVGVIGGQGFLFGRGNQQISAEIIRSVGKHRILAIAGLAKLLELESRCLFVDTGDDEVDRMLCGYIRVVTGPGRQSVVKVVAPESAAAEAANEPATP